MTQLARWAALAWMTALIGCAGPDKSAGDAGDRDDGGLTDTATTGDAGADSPKDQVSSDDAGDAGDETRAAAIEAYATASCELSQRCGGFFMELRYGDLDSCVEALQADGPFDHPGVSATPDEIEACAEAIEERACGEPYGPPACRFTGSEPIGEPCVTHYQCASGHCRTIAPGDTCGTCEEPKQEGDPCLEWQCEADEPCPRPYCSAGLTCAANNTCQVGANVDESCEGVPCARGTCIDGTCVAAGVEDDECSSTDDSLPPCNLGQGFYCDGATNTCQPFTLVQEGDECVQTGEPTLCGGGSYCDTESGVCEAALPAGSSCVPQSLENRCETGLTCVDGTCGVRTCE